MAQGSPKCGPGRIVIRRKKPEEYDPARDIKQPSVIDPLVEQSIRDDVEHLKKTVLMPFLAEAYMRPESCHVLRLTARKGRVTGVRIEKDMPYSSQRR